MLNQTTEVPHSSGSVKVLFVMDTPIELQTVLRNELSDEPRIELVFPTDVSEDNLAELAKHADVLVGWRVSPRVVESAVDLKLYVFAGVGAQTVLSQIRAANETRKVMLVKCVANTYATAQHAVAMLLALCNRIIPHHRWMEDGHWRRGDDYAQSVTLRDRTVGLLGYGSINQNVKRFLSGFEIRFIICKRSVTRGEDPEPGIDGLYPVEQLHAFLERTNILMVGVPSTSVTAGMIGTGELELLGPGSLLVNVARGSVIDEAALYQALSTRMIGGAALDVWYDYRPEPDEAGHLRPYQPSHPFHGLENVVMSPHRAASPVFDPVRWREVADHLRRFVNGEPMLNIVDLDREY